MRVNPRIKTGFWGVFTIGGMGMGLYINHPMVLYINHPINSGIYMDMYIYIYVYIYILRGYMPEKLALPLI